MLAAGRGTRLRAPDHAAPLDADQRAAAAAGLKAMMPIHGRPFLDYVLHSLAEAGFGDIAIVVAPGRDVIRDYYGAAAATRLRVSFLTQQEPSGTADAVLAAKAWAGGEPFIVLNCDNLYPIEVLRGLRDAKGPAAPGFERDSLRLPIERVAAFALLERGGDGCLSSIVEKPGLGAVEAAGPRALVSMNVWRFDSRIFDACRDVPLSARGEKELPQAVGLAASRGVCFGIFPVRGEVLDLSSRADVATITTRLAGVDVRL